MRKHFAILLALSVALTPLTHRPARATDCCAPGAAPAHDCCPAPAAPTAACPTDCCVDETAAELPAAALPGLAANWAPAPAGAARVPAAVMLPSDRAPTRIAFPHPGARYLMLRRLRN